MNACISDSFATPGDWTSYNVMLGIDREYANHMGIQMSPSLTINGKPYYGEMKAN